MTSETQDQQINDIKEERGILSFPDIDAFYSILLERVYLTLERYFLDQPFFLLINALPRNHSSAELLKYPRDGYLPLLYVGIDKMLKIISKEKDPSLFDNGEDKVDTWDDLLISISKSNDAKLSAASREAWERLFATRKIEMPIDDPYSLKVAEDEGTIAKLYNESLRRRNMSLKEIEKEGMGTLTSYFDILFNPINGKVEGRYQRSEYIILKEALGDLSNYNFISLPLIQFAEFDGTVHVIYHKQDAPFFIKKEKETGKDKMRAKNVGNVIKSISFIYEEMILNWDFENAEHYKRKFLKELFDLASSVQDKNALLKELNYAKYYKKYEKYFRNRIEYTAKVPKDAQNLYRRIAIMNILIDSYTHNISAHSLVALESWFKQRAYYLDNEGVVGDIDIPDIDFIKNKDQHFSHEVHEFIRFMLDKGAFWTGLSRDANYGGKVASLYEVLYEDFICNPLYLGTIAYSEGVTKLNINITIQKKKETKGHFILWEKEVAVSGTLASIDLSEWKKNGTSKKKGNDHDYVSGFVHHGPEFKKIKKELEKCKAYFPGGVVGKHALLTIIENEIRNIKHHEPETIDAMRKDGLTLSLSIEPGYYDVKELGSKHKPELHILGIWLNHPQKIEKKDFVNRSQKMWRDIVDENFNPRLGGLTQDKICAAFLFNNEFTKVQPSVNPSERERRFYPWVKLGFRPETNASASKSIIEWEVSSRRSLSKEQAKDAWPEGRVDLSSNVQDARHFFDEEFKGGFGNYKKFIYLWQGEDIFTYQYNRGTDKDWENRARFRFVYLPEQGDATRRLEAFNHLRKEGSIRILEQPAMTLKDAYNEWLRKWIKKGEGDTVVDNYGLYLMVKKQAIALAYWDGVTTSYASKGKVPNSEWGDPTRYFNIQLTHGRGSHARAESNECRYRNHGVFMDYFCKGAAKPEDAEMDELLAAEFIETMATKICMFDKRLVKWFGKWDTAKMEMMGCEVYNEELEQWKAIQSTDFFRFHFVVVHLSFIEQMRNPDTGEKYTEGTIDVFIEKEILKGRKAPENFFLVIASGRGRKQWQYTLSITVEEKGYYAFTVYRPLESLHSAAENSQMKIDDIETKYLLTKILMGS